MIKSHKLFECETDGFVYDGFVQENNNDGYFYVVKRGFNMESKNLKGALFADSDASILRKEPSQLMVS